MSCRELGCQRRPHPESPYCSTHIRAMLARAFGRAVRETEHGARSLPPGGTLLRLADRPSGSRSGRPATE